LLKQRLQLQSDAFDKDPEHVYSPPSTSGGESSASSQGLETV